MISDSVTEKIFAQSPRKFEIVIFCSDDNNLRSLQAATDLNFPACPVKVVQTTAKLRLPPPSNLPLLFLAEYHSLNKDGIDLLKRLRLLIPNAWLCIATVEAELAQAFDSIGAYVDDILPLDEQFAISLKNSANKISNITDPGTPAKLLFKTNTIPTSLILSTTHDLLVIADGDSRMLYTNPMWNELFPDPSIERTYLTDIVHPNDLHRLEAELQLVILEKGTSKTVFRLKSRFDRWETLQATLTGFESEGVHVAFISANIVTELHRLQTKLQELEMQNALIQNNIECIAYRYNLQNQLLQFITEIPLAKYGYTRDDLSKSPSQLYEKLIHPSDLIIFQNFIDSLVRRGSNNTQEATCNHLLVKKDGTTCFVEHSIRLDWSRDGSQFWINGTIKNVPTTISTEADVTQIDSNRSKLFEAMLEGVAEFEITSHNSGKSHGLKCISCNNSFVDLIGAQKDRIIGSHLSDLFPGLDETPLDIDSEESLPQVLERVASGGKAQTIEDYFWPHLRSYFNISATSIRSGYVSLMLTDVTRRKHAEIRLATLLRGLPDTALYQTGGGVEYITEGISEMLGYSCETFQNDRNFFVNLIHPDDRDSLAKAQSRWIAKGSRRVLEMEFRVRHRDGHYIWILDRMSKAFTTPDGRQSSQGVMIDITARKQLEAERQIEIAEMEAVFNSSPELLFRLDRDGKILSYRAGRDDLLFLKPEEFLNKSMIEILPPALGTKFKKALEATLKSGKQSNIEYDLDVPAGKSRFHARFFHIAENLITVVIRQI